jgi:hypothetical protein
VRESYLAGQRSWPEYVWKSVKGARALDVESKSMCEHAHLTLHEIWLMPTRTPQSYPQLAPSALSAMSTQLASILSDHFVPSIPTLLIVPPAKYASAG